GFMVLNGFIDGSFSQKVTVPLKGLDFSRRFLKGKVSFKRSRGPYVSRDVSINGTSCCLVKPTTFMNDSGRAVTSLKTRGIFRDVSELLVVVDDIDLDVGRLRLRSKGSAGGHNGLKSIISHLGTNEFARLRIGVGPRPGGEEMVGHVLGSFKPEEIEALHASLENASNIIEAWIHGGYTEAQNAVSQK
ncbi:aminoacyl-tRNA hydrolase, partial [Candidatus Latescibacterota bacterium]